jgi:serine protease Do
MKRIIFAGAITFGFVFTTLTGFSQSVKKPVQKGEEIIIRKNDDSKAKTVIVIDSNRITINGQPLSDYVGDVKVITRKFMGGNSGNSLFMPGTKLNFENFNSSRTFLGVLSEKSDKGVLIKTVTKGSSAEKAGLKEQDIITKLGDKKITSPEELADAVKSYKPGDEVTINYLRNGKKKAAKVVLGKSDNAMAFNFNIDSLYQHGRNFNFKMPEFPRLNNLQGSYFNSLNRNQPKLGLKIQDTEDGNGIKILDVESGSAADKAGLKKEDIINEMNGEKVNSISELMSKMGSSENKRDYKLKVKRGNTDLNFDVKVPEKLRSADL